MWQDILIKSLLSDVDDDIVLKWGWIGDYNGRPIGIAEIDFGSVIERKLFYISRYGTSGKTSGKFYHFTNATYDNPTEEAIERYGSPNKAGWLAKYRDLIELYDVVGVRLNALYREGKLPAPKTNKLTINGLNRIAERNGVELGTRHLNREEDL